MSEKYNREQRLTELSRDRDKLAGKIISLKVYCKNNPNDNRALRRLVRLIEHGKKVLGGYENVTL